MNERKVPSCAGAEASGRVPSCCCTGAEVAPEMDYVGGIRPAWVSGEVETAGGPVPMVSTALSIADRLGSWRMRWGMGRFGYAIRPGLYAVGEPGPDSPVFVSANYKMSFDRLRASLAGLSGWILALDTRGINVWCAAGKGTFGTDEVVGQVGRTQLARVVSHRTLVLPQLGAPGVSAAEVRARCGFEAVFGPVRAADIPAFMEAGMKADAAMRRVRFGFRDRVTLAPVELAAVVRHPVFLAFLALWSLRAFGVRLVPVDGAAVLGAVLTGTVAVPALLPWIPGRALAWKGWLLGLAWAAAVCAYRLPASPSPAWWLVALSYGLLLPGLSAFLAMNFTGSTTYTSLSGVLKEMRIALPLMVVSGIAGIGALAASFFLAR